MVLPAHGYAPDIVSLIGICLQIAHMPALFFYRSWTTVFLHSDFSPSKALSFVPSASAR